jgi:hypothetical protein
MLRYTKRKMVCEKNCGSPHEVRAQKRHTSFVPVAKKMRKPAHEVRAQKRHTSFVPVSAIFANYFCLGITFFFDLKCLGTKLTGTSYVYREVI